MFQNNNCAQNQAHAILRALSAAAARTQRREAESEGRSLPSKVLSARQAGTGEMAPGCAHSPAAAEPSMAERAFFNNKCFKIITARRIERAEFCAHSRRRQAAAGLSQPLVTVPPATAPNEAAAIAVVPPTKRPRPRLASYC